MVKRQSKAKRRGKQGASSARESDVARAGRITAGEAAPITPDGQR